MQPKNPEGKPEGVNPPHGGSNVMQPGECKHIDMGAKALTCAFCAGTGHILLRNTTTASVGDERLPEIHTIVGVRHCYLCKGTGVAPEV